MQCFQTFTSSAAPKVNGFFLASRPTLSTKFHIYRFSSFCVILLTDRQTNTRRWNTQMNKGFFLSHLLRHKFLGAANSWSTNKFTWLLKFQLESHDDLHLRSSMTFSNRDSAVTLGCGGQKIGFAGVSCVCWLVWFMRMKWAGPFLFISTFHSISSRWPSANDAVVLIGKTGVTRMWT